MARPRLLGVPHLARWTCSCPDHMETGYQCKHIHAANMSIRMRGPSRIRSLPSCVSRPVQVWQHKHHKARHTEPTEGQGVEVSVQGLWQAIHIQSRIRAHAGHAGANHDCGRVDVWWHVYPKDIHIPKKDERQGQTRYGAQLAIRYGKLMAAYTGKIALKCRGAVAHRRSVR